MTSSWVDETKRDGTIKGSRLQFGRYELVVHRHIDHEPDQWLCSCYALGVDRKPIGGRGIPLDNAKELARVHLLGHLSSALAELQKAGHR